MADVVVDVEVGVFDPVGEVQTERHRDQPAAVRRELVDARQDRPLGDSSPAPPVPGLRVEDHQRRNVPEHVDVSMFKKLASIPPSCFIPELLTRNSSG